jgi:eukaryotic-like serine/threonine-protein kinase
MIGLEIGSYKLVTKIGEGGMGEVYLAEHNLLKRKAAVKLLLEEFNGEEMVVKRFIQEARATSKLIHPGIVQIYDFGKTPDGKTYMIMEFLEGETLSQRIRNKGKLPLADAVNIVRQMSEALAVAHGHGVVHRDLKPDNVFIVADVTAPRSERVKILDFGIAKMMDPSISAPKTATGSVLGTPVYMAPEQCQGLKVDLRADLYALGGVFFHLLCGRPPFNVSGIGELLGAHLYSPPPVPSTLVKEITPSLDAIVLKLLAKKPDERYPSTLELIAALDAAPVAAGPAAETKPEANTPEPVMAATSGPEAATIVGSAKQRIPTPREAPAPEITAPSTTPPPQVAAPMAAAPQPVEQPKKEITTLGGSAGESKPKMAMPQLDRPRGNSLVTMAVAFGITVVLAVGAYFVFGSKSEPTDTQATPPPAPVTAPLDLSNDAG